MRSSQAGALARGPARARVRAGAAAAGLWGLLLASPVGADVPPAGEPLRAFTLADLDGRALSATSAPGKVVSVHFFAIWCEPCMADLPEIEKAAVRYGPRGYQPLLVAVRHRQDPRRLRDFAQKRGLTVPIVYDADGAVEALYGVTSLPSHVLAGRDGVIRWSGTALPADLLQRVNVLLDEKPR